MHYYVDFVSIEILNFVVNYHLINIEQEQYHRTHLNDAKITSKPYLQEKTHPIVKIMGACCQEKKTTNTREPMQTYENLLPRNSNLDWSTSNLGWRLLLGALEDGTIATSGATNLGRRDTHGRDEKIHH